MFRLKLVVFVLALSIVCPSALLAQEPEPVSGGLKLPTAMFATAAVADWATTYHGIKYFRLREANPVLRPLDRSPAKMVLLGGAIDIAAVSAWNYGVGRKHPKVAAAGLWTMTAFRAYLAVHNLRNQQKAGRR
jgi:hypothetical protein